MRRILLRCGVLVLLVATMTAPVAAGPRGDALARIGVQMTLFAPLDDGTLKEENGCVAVAVAAGAEVGVIVCRTPTGMTPPLSSHDLLRLYSDTIARATIAALSPLPGSAAKEVPLRMKGETPDASETVFTTTPNGIFGASRLYTFTAKEWGEGASLYLFVASAPNGDAVTVMEMMSPQYANTAPFMAADIPTIESSLRFTF